MDDAERFTVHFYVSIINANLVFFLIAYFTHTKYIYTDNISIDYLSALSFCLFGWLLLPLCLGAEIYDLFL